MGDICTNTRRTVAYKFWEKHPNMSVTSLEKPMCMAFEEYEEVPENVPQTSQRTMSHG